jgi:hypothetical protein
MAATDGEGRPFFDPATGLPEVATTWMARRMGGLCLGAPRRPHPRDPAQWKHLRRQLGARQHIRRCGLRFRRDPDAYLRQLEADLLRLTLPS